MNKTKLVDGHIRKLSNARVVRYRETGDYLVYTKQKEFYTELVCVVISRQEGIIQDLEGNYFYLMEYKGIKIIKLEYRQRAKIEINIHRNKEKFYLKRFINQCQCDKVLKDMDEGCFKEKMLKYYKVKIVSDILGEEHYFFLNLRDIQFLVQTFKLYDINDLVVGTELYKRVIAGLVAEVNDRDLVDLKSTNRGNTVVLEIQGSKENVLELTKLRK